MAPRCITASISLLLCALVATVGCASSSKKPEKKKRTVLSTHYDDARVGRETSKAVAAQMGVVADDPLTAYVSAIGHKLLRGVPRRSFQFQFQVVDQVEPNAFALPGGYIYVSRGLLALANNEDELACVLGHETTHVIRRYAAAQQEAAAHSNPLSMPWAKAADMASYGRDMERDADKGGQILCAAAGYNPMGMSTFLKNMGLLERMVVGHSRIPSFFDTHPGSTERAAVNAVRASELRWKRDPNLGDTQVSYYKRIDGLALGQRPEGGMFVGDLFVHPDLNFAIRFPAGWQKSNTNQAVGAGSPQGDAVVFLTADQPAGDPKTVAEAWVTQMQEQQSVKIIESQPVMVGEIEAWRMHLEAKQRGMTIASYVTFIPYSGATWRITGASPALAAKRYLGRTLATARSFRPLTEKERRSLSATRLRVVKSRSDEGLQSLGSRTGNVWSPQFTAAYNGVFVSHLFPPGSLVKVANNEPYVPKTP
jgi:predicted Zn-dependent protease